MCESFIVRYINVACRDMWSFVVAFVCIRLYLSFRLWDFSILVRSAIYFCIVPHACSLMMCVRWDARDKEPLPGRQTRLGQTALTFKIACSSCKAMLYCKHVLNRTAVMNCVFASKQRQRIQQATKNSRFSSKSDLGTSNARRNL